MELDTVTPTHADRELDRATRRIRNALDTLLQARDRLTRTEAALRDAQETTQEKHRIQKLREQEHNAHAVAKYSRRSGRLDEQAKLAKLRLEAAVSELENATNFEKATQGTHDNALADSMQAEREYTIAVSHHNIMASSSENPTA